ncbi:hypothetical protein H681_11545 [Pseudomonas sp. ATCC 13867]|nr:hypothetical protein H681_11545 [Pseudomonas sp. ATCC 13867]RFQ38679.1 hypothetical protein D0N87_06410 [Pseudomonas sp. ATCC 13867]
MKRHALGSAFGISLLALGSLAGCAQTSELQLSWDNFGGTTRRDNVAYLDCVGSKVAPGAQTFISTGDGTGRLLVGSDDPRQASGIVDVTAIDGGSHFNAYQSTAWQDKGELLDAAYLCSLS